MNEYRLRPLDALLQVLAIMGDSGLLIARVRSHRSDKDKARVLWRVMPYWVEGDQFGIILRPLGEENRGWLHARGWWWEEQPCWDTLEEAWEDAQRMRHIAIPLSGEGVPYRAPLTEDEALEIVRDLRQRLDDLQARTEWWESADTLSKWAAL